MGQLSPSGISGPKLTALERAVDEIIDFERPVQEEPVDGEYMNENRGSVSAFAEHYFVFNSFLSSDEETDRSREEESWSAYQRPSDEFSHLMV